jgi:hypothetical protein
MSKSFNRGRMPKFMEKDNMNLKSNEEIAREVANTIEQYISSIWYTKLREAILKALNSKDAQHKEESERHERDRATLAGANTELHKEIVTLNEQVRNAEEAEKREIEDWKDLFTKHEALRAEIKKLEGLAYMQGEPGQEDTWKDEALAFLKENSLLRIALKECVEALKEWLEYEGTSFKKTDEALSIAQSILGEKK